MRECFSLFLWKIKDHQTKELRLNYYRKIFFKEYHGTSIYKMIVKDTWWDIKRKVIR